MGGEIGVESEPRPGQHVPVHRCRSARQPGDGRAGRARVALRGLRVLVVDDNATNRAILHEQLSAWGMRCEQRRQRPPTRWSAGGGRARGEPYRARRCSTMQMPDMDGLELAASRARQIRACATAACVMLTSIGRSLEADAPAAADVDALPGQARAPGALLRGVAARAGASGSVARRRRGPAAAPWPARREARSAGASRRVLVVEDNAVNQKVAWRHARSAGFAADVAEDGARGAGAVLAHAHLRLVLMDCQMPDMDGYEATARIRAASTARRARADHRDDGQRDEGDRERCLAAGMDDYLSKPLRAQDLDAVLERWVHVAPANGCRRRPRAAGRRGPRAQLQRRVRQHGRRAVDGLLQGDATAHRRSPRMCSTWATTTRAGASPTS